MLIMEVFEQDILHLNKAKQTQINKREVFNEALGEFTQKYPDVTVRRFATNRDPLKFQDNEAVYQLIREMGRSVLPIITVNSEIISSGEYPTFEELEMSLKLLNSEIR